MKNNVLVVGVIGFWAVILMVWSCNSGIFATPIEFYGRVIDQYNDPVADATIGFSVGSSLSGFSSPISGSSSKGYSAKSDAKGLFSLTGAKGATVSVFVQKDGYYSFNSKASAFFGYGSGPDPAMQPPPTKDKPAIFVLWKKGRVEQLIEGRFNPNIKADGTPNEWDLLKKAIAKPGSGNFKIELWSDRLSQEAVAANNHYTWSCKISVPNGGIVQRTDQYELSAPSDGYGDSVQVNFDRGNAQWESASQGVYFIRLANGCFGRVAVQVVPDGGNNSFVQFSYRVNPIPGDQNLDTSETTPFDRY